MNFGCETMSSGRCVSLTAVTHPASNCRITSRIMFPRCWMDVESFPRPQWDWRNGVYCAGPIGPQNSHTNTNTHTHTYMFKHLKRNKQRVCFTKLANLLLLSIIKTFLTLEFFLSMSSTTHKHHSNMSTLVWAKFTTPIAPPAVPWLADCVVTETTAVSRMKKLLWGCQPVCRPATG